MSFKKLLCLGCAVFFVGCNNNPVSDNGNNNKNIDAPFAVMKSDFVSRSEIAESDPRVSSQANSINKFSAKMYSELAKEEESLFSPYSITAALGMTMPEPEVN